MEILKACKEDRTEDAFKLIKDGNLDLNITDEVRSFIQFLQIFDELMKSLLKFYNLQLFEMFFAHCIDYKIVF